MWDGSTRPRPVSDARWSWSRDTRGAHSNLGLVYWKAGRLDEAEASLRHALSLNPGLAEAHNNLGNVLRERGEIDEAVAAYQRSIQCRPDYAEAHNNLGIAFREQGRLTDALASYRRAIDLDPTFAAAHSNLLYALIFSPDHDPGRSSKNTTSGAVSTPSPLASSIQPHTNDRNPDRRLRDRLCLARLPRPCRVVLHGPPSLGTRPPELRNLLLRRRDRPDGITARFHSYADVWRDIAGLTDEQLAQLVRQDRIDILVDLTMHMARNRLLVFARKPAPVQVCWLAYPGHHRPFDHRLPPHRSATSIPPGHARPRLRRESIRLPDAFWCYDPLASEPGGRHPCRPWTTATSPSAASTTSARSTTSVLALWAQVLRAVDRSRLLLLAPDGSASPAHCRICWSAKASTASA